MLPQGSVRLRRQPYTPHYMVGVAGIRSADYLDCHHHHIVGSIRLSAQPHGPWVNIVGMNVWELYFTFVDIPTNCLLGICIIALIE